MLTRRLLVSVALVLASAPAFADEPDLGALSRAAAEHPDDRAALEAYARAAIAAGRAADAIAMLKDAVARQPSFHRAYYLLAVAYRARGEWLDAANHFRICLELGQQPTDALYGLGFSLARLGDKDGAARALRDYIGRERDPDKARFVDEARRELSRMGRPVVPGDELQQPDFRAARRAPPAPPIGARDRDDLLAPGEVTARADRTPDPDGPIDPFTGRSSATRGRIRDLHDPFAEPAAESEPGEALVGRDGEPTAFRTYATALASYRRALATQTDRVAAIYERGMSLALAGRYREAMMAFDEAPLEDEGLSAARRRVEKARTRH